MTDQQNSPGNDQKQKILNMTLAALVGQVGCLTVAIILIALLGGMYLDNLFDSKPSFTIGLLIGSIPVSMFVMLFVSRATVKKIKTRTAQEDQEVGKQTR